MCFDCIPSVYNIMSDKKKQPFSVAYMCNETTCDGCHSTPFIDQPVYMASGKFSGFWPLNLFCMGILYMCHLLCLQSLYYMHSHLFCIPVGQNRFRPYTNSVAQCYRAKSPQSELFPCHGMFTKSINKMCSVGLINEQSCFSPSISNMHYQTHLQTHSDIQCWIWWSSASCQRAILTQSYLFLVEIGNLYHIVDFENHPLHSDFDASALIVLHV